jgi:RimJ/RimL family protein N-acetyltransferase
MLTTERLLLRSFTGADAPDLQRLINAREIALNTLRIPFPYPEGEAERWISTHDTASDDHVFAVTQREDGALVGCVGLHVKPDHDHAELGYWIGVPFWGRGFASEAAAAVVRFGFETLLLNRIFAMHFSRNPASGRVLQNIGMKYEGRLRQHMKKWDEYVDLEAYGMLRSEFEGQLSLRA